MKGTVRKYLSEVPRLAWVLKPGGIFSAAVLTLEFWWFLFSRKCFYGEKKMVFKLKFGGNKFIVNIYNNTDFLTFRTTYLVQDYCVPEANDPKLIIDAGANVGFVAQYFRAKYPTAKIICIEPIKSNFKKLEENVGSDSNIILINKALGGTNGVQTFHVSGEYSFSASYKDRKQTLEKETVAVMTLGKFFDEFSITKVDLFKFDIEGAEDQVFINQNEIAMSDYYAGEVHGDLMDVSVDTFLSRFLDYRLSMRSLGQDRVVFQGAKI